MTMSHAKALPSFSPKSSRGDRWLTYSTPVVVRMGCDRNAGKGMCSRLLLNEGINVPDRGSIIGPAQGAGPQGSGNDVYFRWRESNVRKRNAPNS